MFDSNRNFRKKTFSFDYFYIFCSIIKVFYFNIADREKTEKQEIFLKDPLLYPPINNMYTM